MTEKPPCLGRIDAACFQHNPQWAKQAFAYRLLHTICPNVITRRLPRGLRIALLGQGVDLPPGIELPPGAIASPGTTFPPGWIYGDDWPDGIMQPPSPGYGETALTSIYLDLGAPGPPHPPAPSPPEEQAQAGSADYYIADGADDGNWVASAYFTNTAWNIQLGTGIGPPGWYWNIYLNFTNVQIPIGATITSAYVTLSCGEAAGHTDTETRIYCNDADSASSPTTLEQADALDLTSQLVNWTPTPWALDHSYDTPDISLPIQAIIDRPGWAKGNNLMIIFYHTGGSTDYHLAYAHNKGIPDYYPQLHVEWEV